MTHTVTNTKTPWVKSENQNHAPFEIWAKGSVTRLSLGGYNVMVFKTGMARVELGVRCLFSGELEAAKKFVIASIEEDKPTQVGEEWLTN